MRARDDDSKRGKKDEEEKPTHVRLASGLLPHLLFFFSASDHAGMFHLRHQTRDVMEFDGSLLTPSAVELTL